MSLWDKLRGRKGNASKPEENGEEQPSAEDAEASAGAAEADGKVDKAEEIPEEEIQELKPITPQRRRVLQQMYVTGKNNHEKAAYEYAKDILQNCVKADPNNLEYLKLYLDSVHKLYKDNKRGKPLAAVQGTGCKLAMKKAKGKKDWLSAYRSGIDMLNMNPWDVATLLSMAESSRYMGCEEAELFWLRAALATDPKSPKLNREAAMALERQGDFVQAITCWHRVEEAKPENEEALKKISQLAAERTMSRQEAERRAREAAKKAKVSLVDAGDSEREQAKAQEPEKELAPELDDLTDKERLKKAIKGHPEQRDNYLELSRLYVEENRLEKAERVLAKGLQAMGGADAEMHEQMEDYRIMRVRQQADVAMRRAKEEQTAEAKSLAKKYRDELNRVELGVYAARCERAPNNDQLRFELGVRLRRAGNYQEAIKSLQQARGDGKRKAAVHLELGQCFQAVKQPKLAMNNYEQCLEGCTEQDTEVKKQTLYLAGVLAMGMQQWSKAESYLTELAGMDYGYRDVAQRLDELGEKRDDT